MELKGYIEREPYKTIRIYDADNVLDYIEALKCGGVIVIESMDNAEYIVVRFFVKEGEEQLTLDLGLKG